MIARRQVNVSVFTGLFLLLQFWFSAFDSWSFRTCPPSYVGNFSELRAAGGHAEAHDPLHVRRFFRPKRKE